MEDLKNETLAETKVENQEKYPVQDFINNSEALGYKKEVVAGALFNCEKAEITKAEFKGRVKNFLGKRVE